MEPTEAQWDGIKAAIRAGNKIEAIKLHREATGASLAESRKTVEQMDARPSEASPPADGIDEALARDIRGLLLKGSKIEAIKHLREVSRLGLKEAKDLVDAIDVRYRAESPEYAGRAVPKGCAGLFLIAVGTLALAATGLTLALTRGV